MLGLTVVVHEHTGRADVRVLTDRRVPHIRQMRNLRPLTDRRVLRLHVRTDLGLHAEPRTRPQIGVRTHRRTLAHLRVVRHRVVHPRARAHDRVRQTRIGTHLGTRSQVRRTQQLRTGMHHRVLLERHLHIDERRRRIHHRHTREHRPLQQPVVQQTDAPRANCTRLLIPRISRKSPANDAPDPMPRLTQNPQHISQVLLALTVVRPHLAQRVREQRAVEREHTRVDLTDRALRLASRPCARRSR